MIRRPAIVPAVLLSTALMLGSAGCSGEPTTRIINEPESAVEATDTITALERGVIRREALTEVREAIATWAASDREGMAEHFSDSVMNDFAKNWEPFDERGLSVKHVHEELYLDMIDLNSDGSQALVTYRYKDTSYLVDASGKKVEDLPAFEQKEIQFTVETDDDGKWVIVRAIGGADAFR